MFSRGLGFRVGCSSPCNLLRDAYEVHVTVHGSDFIATGPMEGLTWFNQAMNNKYEVQMEFLGPDAGKSAEIRFLNRVLRWTEDGVAYEPDQTHAEIIITSVRVKDSKPLATPGANEDKHMIAIR